MTKFSNKFEKTLFWAHLGAKKNFPRKSGSVTHSSYEFLAPCQISEKTNDTIPRKRLNRRTDGRKDAQTLFYRILPATALGSIKFLIN